MHTVVVSLSTAVTDNKHFTMLLLLLHMSLLPAYLLCTTGSHVMAMHLTATNQRPFYLVRDNGYVSSCRSNNLRYHYLRTLLFLVLTWAAHSLLNKHTSSICQSMYFHMRALRHTRPALTEDKTTALMVTLVQSRLDYANSILFKTSTSNIKKLQTAQTHWHTLFSKISGQLQLHLSYFAYTGYAYLMLQIQTGNYYL